MNGKAWNPVPALEEERRRTRLRLADLTRDYAGIIAASVDSNADDEHDPEGATIAFERSQVGSLVEQGRDRLAEVDAALERARTGAYGVCVDCGQPILRDRLEARPTAARCVSCADSARGVSRG